MLYLFVIAFFYICGALAQIRFFSQTNFVTLALFFLAWGNALISISMLFSTFISAKRASVVIGCILWILFYSNFFDRARSCCFDWFPYCNRHCDRNLFGHYYKDARSLLYLATVRVCEVTSFNSFCERDLIWHRALYLMNNACAIEYACYGSLSTISRSDEYVSCVVALLVSSIVYYLMYLYCKVLL